MFEGFIRTEIEAGEARIHLRHGGSGPPLLLLHGNPMTHASWGKIANQLALNYHVVATDLRGYGGSARALDGLGIEAADILRERFGVEDRQPNALLRDLLLNRHFISGRTLRGSGRSVPGIGR